MSSQSRSARTEITLLTLAALLVVGQMYVVIPLFVPMAGIFGQRPSAMVIISSAFGIPYAFTGLLAGPLADAWGAKKIIILSLLATAFSTAAVALAPGFAGLTVLRGLQGVAAGFLAAPVFAYITRSIAPHLRAVATTTVMAAAMSSAIVMQMYGQVVDAAFGWRLVFFILVPLMFVTALFANKLLASTPAATDTRALKAIFGLPRLLKQLRLVALYAAALTLLGGFVAVLSGIALYGPASLREEPMHLFFLRASSLPVMVAVPFLALRLRNLALPLRVAIGLGVSGLALCATAFVAKDIMALAFGLAVCVAGVLIAAPAIVQSVMQASVDSSGAAVSLYTFTIFIGASLGPRFAVLLTPVGMSGLLLANGLLLFVAAGVGAYGATGSGTH